MQRKKTKRGIKIKIIIRDNGYIREFSKCDIIIEDVVLDDLI